MLDILTPLECAQLYGCRRQFITAEIARNNLHAQAIGAGKRKVWIIQRDDFERWKSEKERNRVKRD